jgi:hypothetical protein
MNEGHRRCEWRVAQAVTSAQPRPAHGRGVGFLTDPIPRRSGPVAVTVGTGRTSLTASKSAPQFDRDHQTAIGVYSIGQIVVAEWTYSSLHRLGITGGVIMLSFNTSPNDKSCVMAPFFPCLGPRRIRLSAPLSDR